MAESLKNHLRRRAVVIAERLELGARPGARSARAHPPACGTAGGRDPPHHLAPPVGMRADCRPAAWCGLLTPSRMPRVQSSRWPERSTPRSSVRCSRRQRTTPRHPRRSTYVRACLSCSSTSPRTSARRAATHTQRALPPYSPMRVWGNASAQSICVRLNVRLCLIASKAGEGEGGSLSLSLFLSLSLVLPLSLSLSLSPSLSPSLSHTLSLLALSVHNS